MLFSEDRQRFNIKFSNEYNPRNVNFSHRIYYYFVPELSVGSEHEGLIYTLDLPSAVSLINYLLEM